MADQSLPDKKFGNPLFRRNQERRYLPRWEVNNRVLYRKEEENFYRECFSKDLSSDGVCICSDEPLLDNGRLSMTVYLSNDVAVQVTGKIVWRYPFGERNLIGVRFEDVSQKVQDMILQYAFDLKKEALTKHWFEGWTS